MPLFLRLSCPPRYRFSSCLCFFLAPTPPHSRTAWLFRKACFLRHQLCGGYACGSISLSFPTFACLPLFLRLFCFGIRAASRKFSSLCSALIFALLFLAKMWPNCVCSNWVHVTPVTIIPRGSCGMCCGGVFVCVTAVV